MSWNRKTDTSRFCNRNNDQTHLPEKSRIRKRYHHRKTWRRCQSAAKYRWHTKYTIRRLLHRCRFIQGQYTIITISVYQSYLRPFSPQFLQIFHCRYLNDWWWPLYWSNTNSRQSSRFWFHGKSLHYGWRNLSSKTRQFGNSPTVWRQLRWTFEYWSRVYHPALRWASSIKWQNDRPNETGQVLE